MKQLTFSLRLVTPAFVAGGMSQDVDTPLRHKGEKPRLRVIGPAGDGLRVPSLRGVLRFWYRAKEGPVGDLARREAKVFGSTELGQGLRIVPGPSPAWEPREESWPRGSAQAYLGYGPLNDVRVEGGGGTFSSHNQFAFRDAIPEGTEFSFLALGTPGQIEQLRRCLVLLHLFGGIGGRSRRGWGSTEVVSPEVIPPIPPETMAREWIENLLRSVWPETEERPSRMQAEPAFSAFSRGTEIRVFHVPGDDPNRVLTAFYDRFRATRLYDFRRPQNSPPMAREDHALEAADAERQTIDRVPMRLAFGLPYTVTLGRRARRERKIEYHGVARDSRGNEHAITRRASPLLLKVVPIGREWYGMALFLRSRFFGDAAARLAAEGKRGRPSPPSYEAIERFLQEPAWTAIPVP